MTDRTAPPAAPGGVWDPGQYLRYARDRGRPFDDLVARIPDLPGARPRITDIGCGPGTTTAALLRRWPNARVTGIDNSAEMLKAAEALAGPAPEGSGSLDFALADATAWAPREPHDLIISSAVLHWIPGHQDFFPAWIEGLVPGGTFAFQVPGNFGAPNHTLLREVAARPRWRDRIGHLARERAPVADPAEYLERLTALGCSADVWETTYLHVLHGENAVLEWVKGTALRPVLAALEDPGEREDFLAEYGALLRDAYPEGPAGTVFPFRRIFAVATKAATAEGRP